MSLGFVQLLLQALLVGLEVADGQQLFLELASGLRNLILETHYVLVELLFLAKERLDLLLLLLAILLQLGALPSNAFKVAYLALELLVLEHESLHARLRDGLRVRLSLLDDSSHFFEVVDDLLILLLLLVHLHFERHVFALSLHDLIFQLDILGSDDFLVALAKCVVLRLQLLNS